MVICNEKDRRTECFYGIVFNYRAENRQGHGVAVVINRPAAPSTGRAALRRVPAVSDRPIVRENAVNNHPRDADAADAAAVGTDIPESLGTAKGTIDNVDGTVLVLAEHSYGSPTNIGTTVRANIVEKPAVNYFQAAATYPDRAATIEIAFVF